MKIVKKHLLIIIFVLVGSTILATSFIKVSFDPLIKASISDRQVVAWQKTDVLKDIQLFPPRF